ncbi:MAG: glycosyltransferase family 1 protein [Myxococcota bacterium]
MRIGFYLPLLDDRPAGVGVYIEEICSRLAALNPDVVVYTGSPAAHRPWLEAAVVREFPRTGLPDLPGTEGLRRRARRLRWLAGPILRDLERDGVDVLFSPVQEGPLVRGVRSVVVMHDLTALKFPDAYGLMTVAQTRWLVPFMLRRASAVVAVSENTRRDLTDTFGLDASKLVVVGEGCDRSIFRPRSEEEVASAKRAHGVSGRYMLYAGTFSRHKNLGLVARALAAMGPAFSDVQLVIVGRKDAGAYGEFAELVGALGLAGRVLTPGYVSRDELAALMSGAAAFVFPSRYEGFGLAPLEAMACGAPVVASRVASLHEVVGDGGLLVDAATPVAWGDALRTTLGEDVPARRRAALAQAAKFDWDEAAASLYRLLQTVVSKPDP